MLFLPLYDDAPRRQVPVVTIGLISTCAAVFLWQLSLGPRGEHNVALAYGMIPSVLFGLATLPPSLQRVPEWATLVTSMFLHGGWLHLLGNMLYLWLFGKGVEGALGSVRYLAFYLLCGIAAALTQAFTSPSAGIPMIGASGAIAGTLGAYLLLNPRGNVVVFVWIFIFVRLVTVPAVLLLGLWFLLQVMGALAVETNEPGVAVWAHVGGFITGMALVPLFRRRGVGLLQASRTRPVSLAPPRRPRGPWG
jgi:membrane associated rhomboid family serine protease